MSGDAMITLSEAVARINADPPAAGPVTPGAMRHALAAGLIRGDKVAARLWLVDLESAQAWAIARRRGLRLPRA